MKLPLTDVSVQMFKITTDMELQYLELTRNRNISRPLLFQFNLEVNTVSQSYFCDFGLVILCRIQCGSYSNSGLNLLSKN